MKLDWLFSSLKKPIDGDYERFSESIIYLDREQLSSLYSSLTGLKGRPQVEVQQISGAFQANLVLASPSLSSGVSQSCEISDSYLLSIILPQLKERYPKMNNGETLKVRQKAWLDGLLCNTINTYPMISGDDYHIETVLKTELRFDNLKCELLLIQAYMSSIYRPLIIEEKIFKEEVELFGYVHSCNADEALISPVFIFKRNG